jgi:PAS domain S-box-containing protein
MNDLPEAVTRGDNGNGRGGLAPRSDWSEIGESKHFVQFYESDGFLEDSLAGYIGAGLKAGDGCVVIATAAHLASLDERLRGEGMDLSAARAHGRYIDLDAAETLSRLMVDGSPEPQTFAEVISNMLAKASEGGRRVRIFGEMVAVLWERENHSGAMRLEDLWNGLRNKHSFSLLCAYPMSGFGRQEHGSALSMVCAQHSGVIPAEDYSSLQDPGDRLCAIARLQQRSRSLDTEIAERQEAEDRLQASEMQYRALFEASSDGILIVDPGTLRITDASPSLVNLLCFTREELIGEELWEVGLLGDRETSFEALRVLFEKGMLRYEHLVLRTKSGQLREVEFLASLFRVKGHKVIHCNVRDITERRRAEAEREQLLAREQAARAEAETANRMKDEFLTLLSHELRTPLSSIVGWVDILERVGPGDQMNSQAIQVIKRNAKQQAQIVEDILEVSRIVSGKLRLESRPIDLISTINSAADAVRLAAETKGVTLRFEPDSSVGIVAGDPNRLQQVVWNLLSNAIKFTPRGGRITVSLEQIGDSVVLTVRDTGEGIPPEFLPYVFDRFRQADASYSRRHGGLGLGLAIVRHLVELHGGAVEALSAGPGKGATFRVSLPTTASLLPFGNHPPERRGDELQTAPTNPPSLDGFRILVVEDQKDWRELVIAFLELKGAIVKSASSVGVALEILDGWIPDVLISDLGMPDRDGFHLIRELRSRDAEKGGTIPALALSGYASAAAGEAAVLAGYQMRLTKPIELSALEHAVIELVDNAAHNDAGSAE